MTDMQIHLTSSIFSGPAAAERLAELRLAAARLGLQLGIQLHNTVQPETLDFCAASGLPLSAHAPIFGKCNLNFATRNIADSLAVLDDNAERFRRLGISDSVFHGFAMTDHIIPGIHKSADYVTSLQQIRREELMISPDSGNNRDFTGCAEYRERLAILKENLAMLRSRYPDVVLALENDLPFFGYGAMGFHALAELEHPLCLDTGHLWAACMLLGIDFSEELDFALDCCDIRMCHLHNSTLPPGSKPAELHDGHRPLAEGYLPIASIIRRLAKHRIPIVVLEIPTGGVADLEFFAAALESKGGQS